MVTRISLFKCWIPCLIVWTCCDTGRADDNDYFVEYIQPLLETHCYECHSHAAGEASGGLVLDSKAGWVVGGNSGAAIKPGELQNSLLWRAVNHQEHGLEMPPDGKLESAELLKLKKWIESGAADPREGEVALRKGMDIEEGRKWWAFQPIDKTAAQRILASDNLVAVDESHEGATGANIIDALIEHKLRQADLEPAKQAQVETLFRRVSFDLTGLPPSNEDLARLQHFREEEYAEYIDKLLASRGFAEKWARHWLDIARYADSNGSSFNVPFHEAWRYRDWVIDAIDGNLSVRDFIQKQIAGDLLPCDSQKERDENLIATGYLMLGSKVLGEFDKEQLTLDVVDEQLDTIGKSILGMTLGCARCHDHKFDPIPQTDYYAMAGILSSTITLNDRLGGPKEDESDWHRRGLGDEGDARLEAFLRQNRYPWIKATQKRFDSRKKLMDLESQKLLDTTIDETLLTAARDELAKWDEKLSQLIAQMPPHAMAVGESSKPSDIALRVRGVPSSYGEIVPRGFLQVATYNEPQRILHDQSGRLQLAQWITDPSNPLTARVFVNRVWKHLFREGLVRSVDNFGTTGELPTHPELLDFLSNQFIESEWDLKSLVRDIVMTKAYRREVGVADIRDPENRLLSSQNRRRLDAEEIRDAILMFSGALEMGANNNVLKELPVGDVSNLGNSLQIEDNRRTIYQPVIRTLEPDILQLFDASGNAMVTGARPHTIVAPQALYFLNSDFVQKSAEEIALAVLARNAIDMPTNWVLESGLVHTDVKFDTLINDSFLTIVNRQPSMRELSLLREYLQSQADGEPGLTKHDMLKLCQAILGSTQFQFLD